MRCINLFHLIALQRALVNLILLFQKLYLLINMREIRFKLMVIECGKDKVEWMQTC
jgi:hypothetical protein